jgi:hypothetical protein
MPGASRQTRRVRTLNANWTPGTDQHDGRFEVMIVTEDEQQHVVPASPAAMTAITALAHADTTRAWDPVNSTLIVANIIGTMPWTRERVPGQHEGGS